QKTFDAVWPAVLKLRTRGSPLTLYRSGTKPPPAWGDLLSNAKAAVRIYAPTYNSFVSNVAVDPTKPVDIPTLLDEGKGLVVPQNWPKELQGDAGELPEFVVAETRKGRLVWVPADLNEKEKGPRGFFNRARIDVELVVDGRIIDLNGIRLPEDARI